MGLRVTTGSRSQQEQVEARDIVSLECIARLSVCRPQTGLEYLWATADPMAHAVGHPLSLVRSRCFIRTARDRPKSRAPGPTAVGSFLFPSLCYEVPA